MPLRPSLAFVTMWPKRLERNAAEYDEGHARAIATARDLQPKGRLTSPRSETLLSATSQFDPAKIVLGSSD